MSLGKHHYLVAAALLAMPTAALAQPQGFYLGLGGGANWTSDSDAEGPRINSTIDFDTGWLGSLSGGYSFANGIRTEFETAYRSNSVDSVSNAIGAQGDATSWALMGNLYYDFRNSSRFTPYVGVGLGTVNVDADGVVPATGARINDNDWAFAYQGIAGVSFAATDALSVFGDYRYLRAHDPEFTTTDNRNVEADYANHGVMIGLRYSFGKPAVAKPAPMPAAAPAPAPAPKVEAPKAPRNFLVFFDFDSAKLTPEALQIIAGAATAMKESGTVRLDVSGHADRSGADNYNMALSVKRSRAVKDELVRRGVSEKDIAIFAKGEAEPLVRTADNVKEPQNRRVEIVLK